MKRWVCFFISALICFVPLSKCLSEEAADEWPGVAAKAYVLIDRQSGRILSAYNESEMLPIASTTKIMTALLAIENCSLGEIVTAGENASGVSGTSIYLGIGEQLTMEQMLAAIMLRSANDAAVAIAEHIDGSVVAFAERMNARAKQLGADASFKNPNGLDQGGHLVSALGLALIAREAMGNLTFRNLAAMEKATIPWRDSEYDRVLTNKNKLLSKYEGATGIKTGFTNNAGRCLVFSAERDGMELIGVVLNCGTWFESAAELLDYGFAHYHMETFLNEGQEVTEIQVSGGARQSVTAVAEAPLSAPLASGEEAILMVDVPDSVNAPVERGSQIGIAWIEVDGKKVCEVALVAQNSAGEWGWLPALYRVAKQWAIHI